MTLFVVEHSDGQLSLTTSGITVGSSIDDTPTHTEIDVPDAIYNAFLQNPANVRVTLQNGKYLVAVLQ